MGNGLCVETSSSWTVFDWLDKVLGSIGSSSGVIKIRNDDDFADRLSHHYTPVILIIFTIIVSTKQYAGDPIQCWCPAQFTEAHVNYANQVCWISNTYYIPMENVIPTNQDTRQGAQLTYYQWVPFILLFMALMFKLPRIVWKALSSVNGISIDKVVNLVHELQLTPKADRDLKIIEVTEYFETWLDTARHYRRSCLHDFKIKMSQYTCFVCGRRYGNYFMTAGMSIKVVYLFHSVIQFFILNLFVGTSYASWGFEIISGLADDNPDYMKASPRFPRVTLCDFQIRQMNNVQRWTVQCVLPINLFNSKIFLFIWFWLLFLVLSSFFTLVTNFYAIMFPLKRVQYIKKFLILRNVMKAKKDSDKRLLHRFVMTHLKFDGVFVLRIMARNGTDIIVSQIIEHLFRNYKMRFMEAKPLNCGEMA